MSKIPMKILVINDEEFEVIDGTSRDTLLDHEGRIVALEAGNPVGTVVMTDSNTNPADDLGGTWTLIGKEFSESSFISGVFSEDNDYISSTGNTVYASRIGNRITFYGELTTNASIAADTELGSFNLSTLGIDTRGFPATTVFLNHSTKSAAYSIDAAGTLKMLKVISDGTSTIGSAKDITVSFSIDVLSSKKLDSACDRFFWKRTA